MAIDEKVAGGRVLVLAHTTFDDGGIGQRWKSMLQPRASLFDALAIDGSITGVRIESGAMSIDADLEAALLEIGDSIDARGEINPSRRVCCGESVVSCRGAEVHHHLSCWFDSLTEQLRKHRRQPGSTCKHEQSATQLRPIHQAQGRYSSRRRWLPRSSSTDVHSFARELGGQC